MDYQQPHGYMRLPPPLTADPYQRPPPSIPPLPPNHSWPYAATQFQYQPQTQHSSSLPPLQWPPPHSSEHASYPPPYFPAYQTPPYPAHPHYPSPHQLPPRPPQDWRSGSWSHHQNWQYPSNNNEEDWGAKAKEWAAAKAATENQLPNDPQYVRTNFAPASNYQQYSAADMRATLAARDGSLAGDSIAPSNSLVHPQEVPCSYSSGAGNENSGDRYGKFSSSSSLPVAPHNFGSIPAEFAPDLSDQPLNFAPHFNHNLDPHAQPNYSYSSGGPLRGGEHTGAISSNYAWTPGSLEQGAVYPVMPPSVPLGAQVDHQIAIPSPASGNFAPIFSTGQRFQPTIHITHRPAFHGDAYGVSERPKKASVPNWLREEIIKNKAVITSSAPEDPKDDSQSIEEDSMDKSSRKGYQLDSKSVDSFRSTEDDDEDEDELEAARTAAINQEIKRVLTEVLMKVTDELFDEIATKVLKEDNLSVEVGRDIDLSNTQSVSTPKASGKVSIPIKKNEISYAEANGKSTFGTPGDVLGLGSYASDEEDDELQSSGNLNLKESSSHQQYSPSKLSEGNNTVDANGGSSEATERQIIYPVKLDVDGTSDHSVARDLESSDVESSSKKLSRITEDELQDGSNKSNFEKSEDRNLDDRRLTNEESKIQDSGNGYDKNDKLENKRSLAKKDRKDSESSDERLDKKGVEEYRTRLKTERTEYHLDSKDKGREKGRTYEKVMNTESTKQILTSRGKDGNAETHRASGKKDNDEKSRDKKEDEKRERSRYKSESESGRHKRRRSSPVSVRERESKNRSVVSRATYSESSDDSRRKLHHSKTRKSPSPIRSRKRQISRSSHSKQSKSRHSLATTGGKRSASRSRSRSPVHRRR